MHLARKRHPYPYRLWLMVLGCAVLCLLTGGACEVARTSTLAAAAETPEEPERLPSVVVSAGRVEQRLPDVPTHATVLTREDIERIEVVRGGGSALYGNYALGGVINIVTRKPQATGMQGTLEGGTHNTVDANLQADYVTGPLTLSLQGDVFSTGGFPIVKANQRGAVDSNADSQHQTLIGRMEYTLTAQSSLFVAGSYFHEERGNGTRRQENSTEAGYVAVGGRLRSGDGSDWQLTFYAQLQTFDSTFTRISSDRHGEALTTAQEVPSPGLGGSLQMSPPAWISLPTPPWRGSACPKCRSTCMRLACSTSTRTWSMPPSRGVLWATNVRTTTIKTCSAAFFSPT